MIVLMDGGVQSESWLVGGAISKSIVWAGVGLMAAYRGRIYAGAHLCASAVTVLAHLVDN